MWKRVGCWNRPGLKQGNPLQNFKITHNYLILLFNNYFLAHFLIISISKELIFDYIYIFLEYELRFFAKKCLPLCQIFSETVEYFSDFKCIIHNYLIVLLYYHFLVHFLVISRSKEFLYDYFEVFLDLGVRFYVKKWWPLRPLRHETGQFLAIFFKSLTTT